MIKYIVIINIIEFTLMGIDKYNSIKKLYRIPEIILILFAFIGGSIGGIIGMQVFRHKTKKIKFLILYPISFVINILILYAIIS